MSNMSYCRFENTYRDLMDCYNAMSDTDDLSDSEKKYHDKMIKLCKEVADDFGDFEDDD
jgi:hypothetical protein